MVALLLLMVGVHDVALAAPKTAVHELVVQSKLEPMKRRIASGPAEVVSVHCSGPAMDADGKGISFLFLGAGRAGKDEDCREPEIVAGTVRTPVTLTSSDRPVPVSFFIPAGGVGCVAVAPETRCTIRWQPGRVSKK